MSDLTFDRGRADEVIRTAFRAYEAQTHLYQLVHRLNGDAPQVKYRPEGVEQRSRDDFIRLYFAALTDRRQVSKEVYKTHARLWGTHEWLYRETLLTRMLSPEDLELMLREAKVGVPKESAKNWLPCSETLYRIFDGDPLKLYASGSIDGVIAWKKAVEKNIGKNPIPGFGPKILSLLAIFYEELEAIPPVEGAFPVDVHVQRILISTGIIRGSGIIDSAMLAEFIRPRIYAVCTENAWRSLEVAHALWFLGNKSCTNCHMLTDVHARCPIMELCGGAIESKLYFRQGKWDLGASRRERGIPVSSFSF